MSTSEHKEYRRPAQSSPCVELAYRGPVPRLRLQFAKSKLGSLLWQRYIGSFLDGEELQIVFADCEINVTGKNLVQVLEAIEETRLEGLRELPPEYGVLVDDKPFVKKIEVRRRVEKEM